MFFEHIFLREMSIKIRIKTLWLLSGIRYGRLSKKKTYIEVMVIFSLQKKNGHGHVTEELSPNNSQE